jgi:hypothetical protein
MSNDIDFDWGTGSPISSIPDDNFSSQWERTSYFAAVTYRFTIFHDDGMRLWIDGTLYLSKWYHNYYTTYIDIPLSSGYHTIRIDHLEVEGGAGLRLDWDRNTSACTYTFGSLGIHDETGHTGSCLSVYQDIANLNHFSWNDRASSLLLPNTSQVVLYEDTGFSGNYQVYTSSVSNLDNTNMNNTASSVRIRPIEDAYEPDDTCAAASALSPKGAPRYHTFFNDTSDWMTFEAQASTTYQIETSEMGPDTKTRFTIYADDCTTTLYSVAFTPADGSAWIVWTAGTTRQVYLRVYDPDGTTGAGHFYTLRVVGN